MLLNNFLFKFNNSRSVFEEKNNNIRVVSYINIQYDIINIQYNIINIKYDIYAASNSLMLLNIGYYLSFGRLHTNQQLWYLKVI